MIRATKKSIQPGRILYGLLLLSFLIIVAACDDIPNKFETEDNFVPITAYIYENEEEYSSFIKVIEASNMVDALSAYNPNGEKYTLFLPTNEAFERFFQESDVYKSLDDLIADVETVNAFSRYHVANVMVYSNDFPLGALPDTTLTGDYLTIAYIEGEDSTYFKVNNLALVEIEDLEMTNGVIHVIDHVLEPITYSAYEWLQENPDYSILAGLFQLTGLEDTMASFLVNDEGVEEKNPYSLLIESDSIYHQAEMYSIDDVINKYGDGRTDFTNPQNPIWQFAAYHIMAEAVFLADLKVDENGQAKPFNYNTYASLPVQISNGFQIKVNQGVEVFDSIPVVDTIYEYIDYLEILVKESNIQTRNGPVHVLNRVMKLYRPNRTQRTFQFYEDPVIMEIRNTPRTYVFKEKDKQDFTFLSWTGLDEFTWVKSSSSFERASNQDYILVDGDFTIQYEIPQILPGRYGLQLRANSNGGKNATIEVFLDGKKIGGNVNLTAGGNPYRLVNLGIIELGKYEKHVVEVRTLIPGKFVWDYIRFENNLGLYNDNN